MIRLDERGGSVLWQVILGAAMSVMLLGVGLGAVSMHAGQLGSNSNAFVDGLAQARQLAGTTSTGATVIVDANSVANQTTWTVYEGRPAFGALSVVRGSGVAPGTFTLGASKQFAVFFTSGGAANAQAYTAGSAEPADAACPASGSWTFTLSVAGDTRTLSFPCE